MEPETGRQLLREAEPYDDKKVRCHKNYKGKKVCIATCYKKHCHKCVSLASSPQAASDWTHVALSGLCF